MIVRLGFRIGISLSLLFSAVSAASAEPSAFDRAWSHARLYSGGEDSFFQSLDLSGRLQLDLAHVDGGDDSHSEFNVRRFRFGFKSRFKNRFILHVEGEFNPQEADPLYTRLTDAYLAWEFSESSVLKLGKQSAGFTLDGMTSSKSLITIDRNALTNNIWFTEEYIPGISVGGKGRGLAYFVGVFSSGDKDPEFGDFKGGQFVLATLGRDFAAGRRADEALLRVNMVYNEPDPDNGFTNDLESILSLNFSYRRGAWGFRTDLSGGTGYGGQSDLWGFVLMPFYRSSERIEWVARYTYVTSRDENGVRFGRYEREIAGGRGDRYGELYLGFNYYWYGHRLKLQNGLQYVSMEDRADDGGAFDGWSWTTGFRVSW